MRPWDSGEWAQIKGSDLAAKLRAAGYTVLGVTNGKPQLQEEINNNELQLLISKLLRGDASKAPKPIPTKPAYEPPTKKRAKK